MSLNRSRQLDIFRPEQARSPITIIGAGGIGSPTALALAMMGAPDITLLDFDVVEEHNRASQLYPKADIGRSKVESLARTVEFFTDCRIKVRQERYVDQPLNGLVIAAVDTMAARKAIWDHIRYDPNISLYIDGRMAGQVYRLLTARPHDPDDVNNYERNLFTDEQAMDESCTARSIAYNTFGIASVIAATVCHWWVEGRAPRSVTYDFSSFTSLAFW